MANNKTLSWGEWIRRRASFLGIKTGESFAREIGCKRQLIVRWVGLPSPPREMRKCFDSTLVRVLRTDRETLFVNYAQISPESAPLLDAKPEPFQDEGHLRRKVLAVVELLGAEQLRQLYDDGRKLLATAA